MKITTNTVLTCLVLLATAAFSGGAESLEADCRRLPDSCVFMGAMKRNGEWMAVPMCSMDQQMWSESFPNA